MHNLNDKIFDCLSLSNQLTLRLKAKVEELKGLYNYAPNFATIIVGNNPASQIYVKNKRIKANDMGIENSIYTFPEKVDINELLTCVHQLNEDKSVDGILVQLPLPADIDEKIILNAICPDKDIDGLHPINIGKLYLNRQKFFNLDQVLTSNLAQVYNKFQEFVPCTPLGCIYLLSVLHPSGLSGKNAVVIGRSNLFGLPMGQLLLNNDATVTICHSKTQNLKDICLQADILIVAVGQPYLINKDYVKPNATVIDVGINQVKVGDKLTIKGDVNLEDVLEKVQYITKVPKGIGLFTLNMLMYNVLKAATKKFF
ncbi:Bifunctional 5,10-methylenetetrahydrofolate dehydrogenase/5,10-methenyltetrahydrofolate cyclohydrolase [Candidatus Hepatincolaceae symbiont of Richtersius coronifer]